MPVDYDEFITTFTYSKVLNMSASSVALCLSALVSIENRYSWVRGGNSLSDNEWDYIDSLIGLAVEELMSNIISIIVPHAMKSIAWQQL